MKTETVGNLSRFRLYAIPDQVKHVVHRSFAAEQYPPRSLAAYLVFFMSRFGTVLDRIDRLPPELIAIFDAGKFVNARSVREGEQVPQAD